MKRHHSRGHKEFNPETLALGYGYEPKLSEGSIKPPVFLTSTFQFESAKEGQRFFELAYGLREPEPDEETGLIYSRLNNPNLQIFEERMAAWDRADESAVFASGMAAISTTMMSLLEPGDHIVSSAPVYGGTHYLFEHVLPRFGIETTRVSAGAGTAGEVREAIERLGREKVRVVYLETPANPSNALIDIAEVAEVARELGGGGDDGIRVAVDNTFLGPLFQRPADLGADVIIYSATKFIGGHSDLIAGLVSGPADLMASVKLMRTVLGTMATPFSGWLLLRSLETLSVRMRRQAKNATRLAHLLQRHPRVVHVAHPSLLEDGDPQRVIYDRCCTGPGSLIAFEVEGGQEAAFRVLDRFEVARLAVSLGGTETLVEHPMTMTHADVPRDELEHLGVRPGLIRVSVGIEHLSDLQRDIMHALDDA